MYTLYKLRAISKEPNRSSSSISLTALGLPELTREIKYSEGEEVVIVTSSPQYRVHGATAADVLTVLGKA